MTRQEKSETYIAILRGINVGGRNKIRMVDLIVKLQPLKFENLRTYIQSGNLVFKAGESPNDEVAEKIKQAIKKEFGFDVPVIVLKQDEWIKIIDRNLFAGDPGKDPKTLHVSFLSAKPQPEDIQKLDEYTDEPNEFSLGGKAIYLYCPNGYSKTKITNNFLEKKLQVTATTRNWATTLKLAQMANE